MRAIQQRATVGCELALTGDGQGATGVRRATLPRCGLSEEGPLYSGHWMLCGSLTVQNEKRVMSRGKDMCEVLGWRRMWRVWRPMWLQHRGQGAQFSAAQVWGLFLWEPISWTGGREMWSLHSCFYICCLRSDSELEADRYTKPKTVLWLFLFKENIWLWNTVPSPKSSLPMFVLELLCMGILELGSGRGEGNNINFPILYLGCLYRGRF